MMEDEHFRHAEEEYFRLREHLNAGYISPRQFEEAVRARTIQDAQGRHWVLGIDTGKWNVFNGQVWVEASPYPGAGAANQMQPPPTTSAYPPTAPLPTQPYTQPPVVAPQRSGMAPLIIGIVVALILAGGAFFALSQGIIRIGSNAALSPTSTPSSSIEVVEDPTATAESIAEDPTATAEGVVEDPTATAEGIAEVPTEPPATSEVADDTPPRIPLSDFMVLYDDPFQQPLILDVRAETTFDEGHIAGAISFPEADVDARVDELSKDQFIVAYCQ